MKVYKVVRQTPTGYVSLLAGGKAQVEYPLGKWAEPPEWLAREGYYLCAFRTLADARAFINRPRYDVQEDIIIFEAEAESKVEPLPPCANTYHLEMGRIVTTSVAAWPPGTVMVCRLKLLYAVR